MTYLYKPNTLRMIGKGCFVLFFFNQNIIVNVNSLLGTISTL